MAARTKGFTLIELLIVVAIIAILAAIAIPNFIEAQVRSKVSRAKADMRSIATAIESYRVDHTNYPADRNAHTNAGRDLNDPVLALMVFLSPITTPISYMSSIPTDPFQNRWLGAAAAESTVMKQFAYWSESWRDIMWGFNENVKAHGFLSGKVWSLTSIGPDSFPSSGPHGIFGIEVFAHLTANANSNAAGFYDSTNGSKSGGDICRFGP